MLETCAAPIVVSTPAAIFAGVLLAAMGVYIWWHGRPW